MMMEYDTEQLAAHLAESARRFPGPDYYEVLGWLHEGLQPDTYLEIGIRSGESLAHAAASTRCIGIDPEPQLPDPTPANWEIHTCTSDAYFAGPAAKDLTGGFAFGFIDGLHTYDQVVADFVHLERYARPESVVVLHDCIPLDAETGARERTTAFWTGDVWKATVWLMLERPELDVRMIPTGPSGLCIVRGFGAADASRSTSTASVDALTFADYDAGRLPLPKRLNNDRRDVVAFASGSGVDEPQP